MHVPGVRTRHSLGRKTTHALSFGGMVLEMRALNAKSSDHGQPGPKGCHWKSTHRQAQVLAVPSNTCLPCVAHLGTPVHATSAQLWHPGSCLCSHSPAAAHSAHAECFIPLPMWPAGKATTHGTAMLPHILCVSGRPLEEEQFPSPGTHAMSGRSEDLNLPSAAPYVPPFRPGLADWA